MVVVENEKEQKIIRDDSTMDVGLKILHQRPRRRNLLFFTTLATLILVFAGAVPLGNTLAANPLWFAAFWIVIFLLAAFVLLLAIYDLMRVRRDHEKRLSRLEKELAEASAEARRLAREELEADREKEA